MGHKKTRKGPAPIPPANQPQAGPALPADLTSAESDAGGKPTNSAGFHERDPRQRLGNFETAGEHSYVQPGGNHDADR